MNKAIFFGLLLVLVVVTISKATAPVDPPSVARSEESHDDDDDDNDNYDKNEDSSESVDDKEQMFCNVIVRATYDLHFHQKKSADEITTYLKTDCKNLETEELIKQCREMVTHYGKKIYEHVANGMEMSQICKQIEDQGEVALIGDEKTDECSRENGSKCECCKKHVEKRKIILRFIVKQMAKKRIFMCKKAHRPYRCRKWVHRREQQTLKRISKICPTVVCKHLGYCTESIEISKIERVVDSPSVWLELLDQKLENHFTKDVCNEFEQFQIVCTQVAASVDGRRYAKMYMTIIHNDTIWIDNDIRERAQLAQPGSNTDTCETCKNIVQSSTAFNLQIVETVRNAFINTCEQCPAKDKCKEFFNKRFDAISVYLHSLKPDSFCSAIHLCSSSPVTGGGECAICIQRLQPRKDAAIQAVNQLSIYFNTVCAKWNIPECHQIVSETVTEARSFIEEFNVEKTCRAMGFCEQNAAHNIDDYEHAFIEEITKQVCSTLGPFETLCQQVVQGDSKQVQTINLNNINIGDFFQTCEAEEKKDGEENAVATIVDQCAQNGDKCQCCIHRVIQKKKCFKRRVAKYVWHMTQLCKKCPAREKCEQHWQKKKECWDAKIDKICPKKACIRMGYCTKIETSSPCVNMGPFKQACESAVSTIEQAKEKLQEQVAAVKP